MCLILVRQGILLRISANLDDGVAHHPKVSQCIFFIKMYGVTGKLSWTSYK